MKDSTKKTRGIYKTIVGDHQAGFTRRISTMDNIFILKETIAKYYKFVDFSKAYDSVSRKKLEVNGKEWNTTKINTFIKIKYIRV